jgi:hypothetical protein
VEHDARYGDVGARDVGEHQNRKLERDCRAPQRGLGRLQRPKAERSRQRNECAENHVAHRERLIEQQPHDEQQHAEHRKRQPPLHRGPSTLSM